MSVNSYRFIEPVGRGAYGEVMLAELKETGVEYAIKIVSKAKLKRENKTRYAHVEKNMLTRLRHPGIVRLVYTFQDSTNLYYVTEYCPGGELLNYINCYAGHFSIKLAKFYTAEVVNILEYLHSNRIAHRDLKPENLLLTADGHLKLIDFGTARDCMEEIDQSSPTTRERRSTFVGTAEYVSPEVLNDEDSDTAVDLWALGCVVFQMIVGKPPFKAANEYLIFERIREGVVEYPERMPAEAVDLISKLLNVDPSKRLGAGAPGSENSYEVLKNHPFFDGINVDSVFEMRVPHFNMIERAVSDDLEVKLLNSAVQRTPEIIFQGVVDKKAGWIFRKRKLVISSQPQISYWHATKDEMKGEIALSADVLAKVTGQSKFSIIRPGRTYYFKTLKGDSPEVWVEKVNKVVADYFSRCLIQMAYLFSPFKVKPPKHARPESVEQIFFKRPKLPKAKVLKQATIGQYLYGEDGKLERNVLAFPNLGRRDKKSHLSLDDARGNSLKPKKAKLRLSKPTVIEIRPPKPQSLKQHKTRTFNDRRVFVALDGVTVLPDQRIPGFRFPLNRDKTTRHVDLRLFFIICKEKLGITDDLAYMFDTYGNSYDYLDEVPPRVKTLLVSASPKFIGIKLEHSKKLFTNIEEDVQLPFKTRLNTTQTKRRNKSQGNIVSSFYEDIDIEGITNSSFLELSDKPNAVVNKHMLQPSNRAATSLSVVRHHKKKPIISATPSTKHKIDYVKSNIGQVGTFRSVIDQVEKRFLPLSLLNIPEMMEKYGFTRVDLHHLYAKYKSMLVTACVNDKKYNISDGVDKQTFVGFSKNGASLFGSELVEKVFDTINEDKSGFINWNEYLSAMSIINTGSSNNKIDLFFNMYDMNKNGSLDYSEIKKLCKLQLKPHSDEAFVEDMANFFTKMLFKITCVPEDQEIKADQLKKAMLDDPESKILVELFCCWSEGI